jgi:aryl-alcohol dehydrogenase-like predicted oxidoreductase
METRACGASGLRLSVLGLGCWSFGGGDYWGPQDQSDVDAVVRRAVSAGLTYFDTAEAYNDGRSEESLGRALRGLPRDRVVIGTKVSPSRARPADLRRACERSLARLGTDVIDLYMVHWPITLPGIRHFDPHATEAPSIDAAFETLQRLRDEGKIRHAGVSNHSLSRLDEARRSCPAIAANELPYNLLSRAIEAEVLPGCAQRAIGVIGYMALLQGVLTDSRADLESIRPWQRRTRHFAASKAPAARHGGPGHEDEVRRTLAAIGELCRDLGRPLSEVALAWTLARPGITCSLVGCRTVGQLDANLRAVEKPLAAEVVARLNAITQPLREEMGEGFDYYEAPKDDRTR